jgi:hypothetical protein
VSFFLLLNYTSMHALWGREIKREKGIQGVDFPTVKSANRCAAAKLKTSFCESSAPSTGGEVRHQTRTVLGGEPIFIGCPFG